MTEPVGLMEPLLPQGNLGSLEDLAFELVAKASGFTGKLNPVVRRSIGDLVRSMNCYYSNLIEGHNTHPRDIDRALSEDYSAEPEKRALQKEAVAHITVQKMIDSNEGPETYPINSEFGKWIHKELCERLPNELLCVENPDTGEKKKVLPGVYRDGEVRVGQHIPPLARNLDIFLKRFDEAYDPARLSKAHQIISVAASHHRYLRIHPFYDGNGRVVRLMSYSALLKLGIGNDVWSVARGLARQKDKYKALLEAADSDRHGDLDGRGTLSQKELINFCEFFLRICIDQVEYMESLLDFSKLSERMRIYIEEEVAFKNLPKGSYPLLREALLIGEFERGRVEEITGLGNRTARDVLSVLVKKGLLVSDTPRSAVRLGFPIDVIERWFPLLYPTTAKT